MNKCKHLKYTTLCKNKPTQFSLIYKIIFSLKFKSCDMFLYKETTWRLAIWHQHSWFPLIAQLLPDPRTVMTSRTASAQWVSQCNTQQEVAHTAGGHLVPPAQLVRSTSHYTTPFGTCEVQATACVCDKNNKLQHEYDELFLLKYLSFHAVSTAAWQITE